MNVNRLASQCLLVVSLFLAGAQTAVAVDNLGVFELDGNPTSSTAAGDDFEDIFNGTGSGAYSSFGTDDTTTRIGAPPDVNNQDISIFSGGSTKDIFDFPSWQHKVGNIQNKDDIHNAYTANYVYTGPTIAAGDGSGQNHLSGDVIYVFGSDIIPSTGSATSGFWFLQDGSFAAIPTSPPGGTGTFAGTHTDGDVFITLDINGTVNAYYWDATAGSNPVPFPTGGQLCGTVTAPLACGISNTASVPVPAGWPYDTANFGATKYSEGGINLSALFRSIGKDLGCFNTFLAESRTSNSLTSVIIDFISSSFESCALEVVKDADELSKVGDTLTYNFEITNTAVIPLTVQSVVDDVIGDITAEVISDGCEMVAAQHTCTVDIDWTVPAGYFTSNNPLTNTVTLSYTPPNTSTVITVTDTHTLELFSPALSMTKTGPVEAVIGETVTYTFELTNDSLTSPTLGAPDLVLGTQFSEPPVITGTFPTTAVDVVVGDATATEGLGLVFDVVLSQEPANAVTVNLSTTDGSATSGTDYTGGTYSVTITPPVTTGIITIPTQTDTDITELSEIFTISIDSATGTGVLIGATSDTGTGTILGSYVDDDVLGLITSAASAAGCDQIATGASCSFTVDMVVTAPPPDSIVNVVDALYHPDGFPNQITATATHTLDVLNADLTLIKTLTTVEPYVSGQVVEYQIEVTNGGPGTATDVTVNDVVVGLSGLLIISVNNPSADPGDCAAGSSFPCIITEMTSGEAVTLTVTATVQ